MTIAFSMSTSLPASAATIIYVQCWATMNEGQGYTNGIYNYRYYDRNIRSVCSQTTPSYMNNAMLQDDVNGGGVDFVSNSWGADNYWSHANWVSRSYCYVYDSRAGNYSYTGHNCMYYRH